MTWELKNKIQEILAKETGAQCFAPGARRAFAFLYPNSYKVGRHVKFRHAHFVSDYQRTR